MPDLRTRLETRLLRTMLGLPPALLRRLAGRPVVREGLVLAPEQQLMLALRRLSGRTPVEQLPLAQGRRELDRQAAMVGGRQPVGAIRELAVDGGAGLLPARLYIPSAGLGAGPAPTLLFLHGGGWVYGGLASHDAACRVLAEESGVQVLALDYRLSPEHPFPAAVEDCLAAYRWLVAHADEVGADPRRLAVGGDSAGGNLAAVVAVHAAQEGLPLAFQLLVYPGTDFVEHSASRRAFGDGFFLTTRFMDLAQEAYLGADGDVEHPDASVLRRRDLPEGLAPAHVVTAGFDPLRDEGEAYAGLLERHGVGVRLRRYPGFVHGFLNLVGVGREVPAAVRGIAGALRHALA